MEDGYRAIGGNPADLGVEDLGDADVIGRPLLDQNDQRPRLND